VASFLFYGEASNWWKSLDEDTRLYATWGKIEELFSNKLSRITKWRQCIKSRTS
jgi:hypothetical protein